MAHINTSHWKLRRLAARAVRVHERQRDKDAGLASFDSMAEAASLYITLYDQIRNFVKTRMKERTEGKDAIADLVRKVRIWAPRVARDIAEVKAGEYGENPAVPDDVLGDAKTLIEHVSAYADRNGEPLSYAETLATDMGAALTAADSEWKEAEVAQEGFAELRKQMLETGSRLEQDLIAYRKTLRQVAGANSPDYQKLRVERAATVDEDDDEIAAALPEGLASETSGETEAHTAEEVPAAE